MAIAFPSSPSVNQLYVYNGITYSWTGTRWNKFSPSNTIIPAQTGNSGRYLTTDGTVISWGTVNALPSQTSNAGKYLTTDGTAASWATVNSLPSQSSNAGKYLTTDGTTASWATVGAAAGGVINQNSRVVSSSYTIGAAQGAVSVGPIAIGNGVALSIGDTARYMIL
jgi:hypothetical protein